ncbi:MAG: hypothetical protein ACLGIN_02195 [Candidatus Sericytochromatia bacterium]
MNAAPVETGELIALSLDALINTASAYLGEPMPDGRRLESPEAAQAWLALYAATALLERMGPLMRPEALAPFRTGLSRAALAFAEAHPDFVPPDPRGGRLPALSDVAAGLARDLG